MSSSPAPPTGCKGTGLIEHPETLDRVPSTCPGCPDCQPTGCPSCLGLRVVKVNREDSTGVTEPCPDCSSVDAREPREAVRRTCASCSAPLQCASCGAPIGIPDMDAHRAQVEAEKVAEIVEALRERAERIGGEPYHEGQHEARQAVREAADFILRREADR